MYKGQPTPGAFVIFHPKDAIELMSHKPYARVQKDGSFSLTSYRVGDGAPSGNYVATVSWHELNEDGEEGPALLPGRFGDATQSKFFVEVKPGDNNLPPFILE